MKLARNLPRRLFNPEICALVFAGCSHPAKNDPVAAMNDFFTLLVKQHYYEAYESASVPFKIDFNEKAFEAVARDFGLGELISSAWRTESIDRNTAVLEGKLLTKTNQTLLFRATLIRESGWWKLYLLQARLPQEPTKVVDMFGRYKNGIDYNQPFARQLPDDDEIRELVTETMLKFNESLHQKNFEIFYDYTSSLWQAKTTEEQVARAFKPYIEANATLDFIRESRAIFTEAPRINSDGYMAVNGYYPTQPRLIFHLQYVFELPRWKIIGITLSIEP